ncbi:DUF6415 family natural product biosynthesis protein [Streptomyces sp. JV176]|uniref:DUF6415 family natural product biosynthesis protein n=1 Tax=Streptomyces sp. JV176 TaxID=858630 RepID=UPI002E7892B0|nr:DUF6415 family natural product biosynthesis protein [Streptomyces sp. JV176]MEE1797524.1 DUF6415 family natural product biosynthesis protein [Streptomyces sp. JV176]
MTTVMHETSRPSGGFSNDDATAGRIFFGLLRFLAAEAITDELYGDLEAVLGEYGRPSLDDGAVIADRLREASTKLVEVVPRLIQPYPMDQQRGAMDQLFAVINLSAEQPTREQARGHLVRFASSILTLLDQMGEVAS